MAVGAIERAVDGVLKLRLIHMQADLLAVLVLGHGRIAVASQALNILDCLGFRRPICLRDPDNQDRRDQP
jgi:hypothetical protein